MSQKSDAGDAPAASPLPNAAPLTSRSAGRAAALALTGVLLFSSACGGDEDEDDEGAVAGKSGTGGSTNTGGNTNTGGLIAMPMIPPMIAPSGGTLGTGGRVGTGGTIVAPMPPPVGGNLGAGGVTSPMVAPTGGMFTHPMAPPSGGRFASGGSGGASAGKSSSGTGGFPDSPMIPPMPAPSKGP